MAAGRIAKGNTDLWTRQQLMMFVLTVRLFDQSHCLPDQSYLICQTVYAVEEEQPPLQVQSSMIADPHVQPGGNIYIYI